MYHRCVVQNVSHAKDALFQPMVGSSMDKNAACTACINKVAFFHGQKMENLYILSWNITLKMTRTQNKYLALESHDSFITKV